RVGALAAARDARLRARFHRSGLSRFHGAAADVAAWGVRLIELVSVDSFDRRRDSRADVFLVSVCLFARPRRLSHARPKSTGGGAHAWYDADASTLARRSPDGAAVDRRRHRARGDGNTRRFRDG